MGVVWHTKPPVVHPVSMRDDGRRPLRGLGLDVAHPCSEEEVSARPAVVLCGSRLPRVSLIFVGVWCVQPCLERGKGPPGIRFAVQLLSISWIELTQADTVFQQC